MSSAGSEVAPASGWAKLVTGVRAQLQIDHTGAFPQPDANLWHLRTHAWLAIVMLFAIGWGLPAIQAVAILVGIPYEPAPLTTEHLAEAIVTKAAVIVGAIFIIRYFRRHSSCDAVRPSLRVAGFTFAGAFAATLIGFSAGRLIALLPNLSWMSYPPVESPTMATHVLRMVLSGLAGPSEELALMALVVIALRTSGYGWRTVLVVAVLVRVPFHLYYGWGAIGLALWAVLIVGLYRRTGALTAIIVAHSAWNLAIYLPGATSTYLTLAVVLLGIVGLAAACANAQNRSKVNDD
jgi:hypothetical protein